MPQKLLSILATALSVTALLACSAESDDDGGGGKSSGDTAGSFGNANQSGSGTSAGGTAGTTGTATGGGQGCASIDIQASRVTPTIWLVIDGSGSMSESFGASDRWTELRAALMDMTGGVVPRLQSAVVWGMVMYDGPIDFGAIFGGFFGGGGAGMGASGTCPRLTVVDPKKDNAMAIDAAYPAQPPGGSTPTHIALQEVLPRVQNPPPAPDGTVTATYVVLATDGAPNDFCSGGVGADAAAAVLAATQAITDVGTKTYVISLAGGDANLQAHLEQVAMIGGTGKAPFTPMSKEELLKTFEEIIGGNVGCEVRLNGKVTPGSECAGVVRVKGVDVPCNDPNGWMLKDEQTIVLQGTACQTFQGTQDTSLYANFPCDVFTPE